MTEADRGPVTPSQWRAGKRFARVMGHRMAYVESGAGRPIVLMHGNPTSSYLWRSVLPALEGLGRCIVPDLIGMGDSGKLDAGDPGRYTFGCHRDFVDGLLQALGADRDVVLVVHDWGSALGFDWACRHPGQVRAVAYMEYRRPFGPPGDGRLPTLVWPRQIPIAGEPADVHQACAAYATWLASAPGLPKLFVNAEPGIILTGAVRDFCRTWPDQAEVTVPGLHFIQEDSGAEIGRAIATWLRQLPAEPGDG